MWQPLQRKKEAAALDSLFLLALRGAEKEIFQDLMRVLFFFDDGMDG